MKYFNMLFTATLKLSIGKKNCPLHVLEIVILKLLIRLYLQWIYFVQYFTDMWYHSRNQLSSDPSFESKHYFSKAKLQCMFFPEERNTNLANSRDFKLCIFILFPLKFKFLAFNKKIIFSSYMPMTTVKWIRSGTVCV